MTVSGSPNLREDTKTNRFRSMFSVTDEAGRRLGVNSRRIAAAGLVGFVGASSEAFALVIFAYLASALTEGLSELSVVGVSLSPNQAVILGLTLLLLRVATGALAARTSARVGRGILVDTRSRLLEAFLAAAWTERQARPIGDLQERFSNHVDRAAEYFVWQGIFLNARLALFAYLGTAFIVAPEVALIAGLVGGAVIGAIRPLSRRARTSAVAYAQHSQRLAVRLTDYVMISRDIEVFGVREPVLAETRQPIVYNGNQFFLSRFFMQFSPQMYQAVLMGVGMAAIAAAFATDLDPGSLSSIGAVLIMLLRSMSAMQQVLSARQALVQRRSYVDMTANYLEDLEASRAPAGTEIVESVLPLSVENAGFAYDGADAPVFEGLNFAVRHGEALGVAGPSGAGKTTLVSLLLRLREPTSGQISAGGIAVQTISDSLWTEQVSFVPQDPVILPGSLADNVRFFRDIDDGTVRAALRSSHLESVVDGLPQGIDTKIGEDGVSLSGGQKQRLAIARALAGSPALLILDEPTSALDTASEVAVRETLADLRGTVAVIVIAHRGSTLSICDRILLLEGGRGRVIERESADEALDRYIGNEGEPAS